MVNGRGQLVVPTAAGSDLEAYAVVAQQVTRIWRAHPGGNIVTVDDRRGSHCGGHRRG